MDPRQDAGGTVRTSDPRPGRAGHPTARIPRPGPLHRRFAEDKDLDGTSGNALPGVDEAGVLFEIWRRSRRAGLAERIFDLTAPRLRLVASSLLADPNDVDDVLQETYLIAFAHPERYAKDRPLLPWLGGILRNRIRMDVRSTRRRRQHEAAGDPEVETTDEAGESFEVVEVVQRGIDNLPNTYRQVVARRVLDGAPFPTIAAELGRTENTVRVQCGRGLHMLRRTLPAGIGACLAAAMLPERIAAATRDLVVHAAARPPIGPDSATALATGGVRDTGTAAAWQTWRRLVAVALLGAAAVAVGITTAPSGAPQAAPTTSEGPTDPAVASVGDAGTSSSVEPAANDRSEVAPAPAMELQVRVTLHGRPAVGAPVSAEVFDPRSLFVRTIHDGFGSRSVPEHPVPADAERALTDAEGVARLAVGPDELLVRVPGGGAFVSPRHDRRTVVDLEIGERALEIRGRVVDLPTGSGPLELLVRSGPYALVLNALSVVDEDGHFATVVGRGSAVCARRGTACSDFVEIGSGTDEALTLGLHPGTSVHGTVLGPDGHPVPHAVVDAAAGRMHRRARADGSGRFALPGLPAGDLTVAAHSPTAGISSEELLTLEPGARRDLHLTLRGVGRISGRVVDPEGRPLAHTRVRTGWTFDSLGATCTATDENGDFVLAGVPAGPVRIEAGLGQGGLGVAQLALEADQELSWNPVLDPDWLQLTVRFELPDNAPPLSFALDARDHLIAQAHPVIDGAVTIRLDPDSASRDLTGRLYLRSSIGANGRARGFPLAIYGGLQTGAGVRTLPPPADFSARASASADILAMPGLLGEVRLTSSDAGHWIRLGTLQGTPGERIAMRQTELPAGRYRIHVAGQASGESFELREGQQIDLGVVTLDRDSSPGQRVQLVFEHPGDGTPMDRLTIELADPLGPRRIRTIVPGAQGMWSHTLSVPPGRWEITAHTGNGLSTSAEIDVFADRPLSRRLRLSRSVAVEDGPAQSGPK